MLAVSSYILLASGSEAYPISDAAELTRIKFHLLQQHCSYAGNSPVDNRATLRERDRNQSLEAREWRERKLAVDSALPQRVRDAPVLMSSSG